MKRENHHPTLVAPCGMNCSICVAYLREKNKCPGCRGSDANKPKTRVHCKIKTCPVMIEKGVSFCFECEEFPCKLLLYLDKRYRMKYHMSMIENLESIKNNGIESFLNNEKVRWLCSACGGTICVHEGLCHSCKKPKGR